MNKHVFTLACLFLCGQSMVAKQVAFNIAVFEIENQETLDLNNTLQSAMFNLLQANNEDDVTATYSFDSSINFEDVVELVGDIEATKLIMQPTIATNENETGTIEMATNESDTTYAFGITPQINDNNTLDISFEIADKTLLPSNIVPGETFIISNNNMIILISSKIID